MLHIFLSSKGILNKTVYKLELQQTFMCTCQNMHMNSLRGITTGMTGI